ncbi:MAG: galactose-1-phosphate uridylyltransferase [Planctomycetaceae bacterium]
MPEMRRNPLTGEWTLYAPERAARPTNYDAGKKQESSGFNPFLEGNESKTTPEILAVREAGSLPNTPGWQARVIFNKYPAVDLLQAEALGDPPAANGSLFESRAVPGCHDVIIESPKHITRFHELSLPQMKAVFGLYLDRWKLLSVEPALQYALLFKNEGPAAGASLEHVHSQCIGLPFVPAEVKRQLQGAEDYFRKQQSNFFDDWLAAELNEERRIIKVTDEFVVVCPYFSRFPYETWIVPRRATGHFEEASRQQTDELAGHVHQVLNRYQQIHEGMPFNYMLQSAPFRCEANQSYRWYLQITPRISHLAGLELGSGVLVNLVLPDTAAELLRG